jgi:hypothetical protein
VALTGLAPPAMGKPYPINIKPGFDRHTIMAGGTTKLEKRLDRTSLNICRSGTIDNTIEPGGDDYSRRDILPWVTEVWNNLKNKANIHWQPRLF